MLAILVNAHTEVRLMSQEAMIASKHIGGDLLQSMTNMGRSVGIINCGRYIIAFSRVKIIARRNCCCHLCTYQSDPAKGKHMHKRENKKRGISSIAYAPLAS